MFLFIIIVVVMGRVECCCEDMGCCGLFRCKFCCLDIGCCYKDVDKNCGSDVVNCTAQTDYVNPNRTFI